jgi:hypothetical protein
MTRTLRTARDAGARFERLIADTLALHLDDDRIDRRPRNGAKDRGDIGGWRYAGMRLVAECKNTARLTLAAWIEEAEIERRNDDAAVGMVIHKRIGRGDPLDQYVTLTLRDLLTLLLGRRP